MAASTKQYVVDASYVLSFLMPDEFDLNVHQLFNQFKSDLIVFVSNPLLSFEVINGLKTAILKKRISLEYASERIKEFLDYDIHLKEVDFLDILLLAEKYGLTTYDASYLYLARKLDVPLLTLDNQLKKFS